MLRTALLSLMLLAAGCGDSGPVTVVIHGDRPDQVWEGFGACASTWSGVEVWSGPAARLEHSIRPNAPVPQPLRDEALRIVLEEFRLNWFYAGALSEPVNDNDDPCTADVSRFAFEGSDFGNARAYSGLDEYVDDWVLPSRSLPSRPEIEFHFTLYMNGRCAPDWLERLGGTDVYEAIDRGLEPAHVVEVAEHLATMVQHWTKRTGRAPQTIGLFNEPGGKENVGGPVLRACTLVLGRRLSALGLPTRIVLADAIVSEGHAGTIAALLESEEARSYIGAVSYHRYVEEKHLFENIGVCREAVDDGDRLIEKPVSYVPKALAAGKGVRLTETMFYQPDDVSEHGRLRTVCLFDEINFGRATACYGIGSAFYQSDPGVSGNTGKTGPAATLVYDERTKLFTGVEVAPSWQWLGLLSSSVKPGSRRLESECDDDQVRPLAFLDRSAGRVVVLLLNPGDDDRDVDVTLGHLVDAKNTSRKRTSGAKKGGLAEARVALDTIEVRDAHFKDRLPSRSLTAYEFETAASPAAHILSPNEIDGWTVGEPADLEWRGRRAEGYALDLSLDGGATYVTIAEGVGKDAEFATIETTSLAASTAAIVRLRAGDAVAATSSRFTVREAPEKLEILRPKLGNLEVGTGVPGDSGTLEARGGTPPFNRWSIAEGELPPGVRLDPTGGVLFGRPMRAGKYRFVVALEDSGPSPRAARRAVTVDVADAAPEFRTPDEIPKSAVGNVYRHTLATRGGTLPLRFAVVQGSLPPGLEMDGQGVISGKPSVAGNSRIVVEVTDASLPPRRASRSFGIAIEPAPLHSNGPSLGTFRAGEAIDFLLPIGGGKPPYRVRKLGGDLPPGLELGDAGRLAGSPRKAGTYIFSALITDADRKSTHQGYRLIITD